jgi:hypothetical protein
MDAINHQKLLGIQSGVAIFREVQACSSDGHHAIEYACKTSQS